MWKAMDNQAPPLDRRWHLGETRDELFLADFEYTLMRAVESFDAWQQECLAAVAGHKMSATDNVVLHITRMNDRPKSVTELSKLMNRSDLSNLKYSVRKLVETGLLEKVSEGGKRKGMRYRATSAGIELTEAYARLRRDQLLPAMSALANFGEKLEQVTSTLQAASGIYEQCTHLVAFHRGPIAEEE
jgi:predicted MarR family transcription regulator